MKRWESTESSLLRSVIFVFIEKCDRRATVRSAKKKTVTPGLWVCRSAQHLSDAFIVFWKCVRRSGDFARARLGVQREAGESRFLGALHGFSAGCVKETCGICGSK